MIKGVHKIMVLTEMIIKFGYHSAIQRFKLKDITDTSEDYQKLYYEIFTGLCPKDARYQLHIASAKGWGHIQFIIYDTELDRTVQVFATNHTIQRTTLYPTWGVLMYQNDEVTIYDKNSEETNFIIDRSLGEDQHFQIMMERDAPGYEDLQNLWSYMDQMMPVLKQYRRCNLISYQSLDVDLSSFEVNPIVLVEIENEFPGILDCYLEAEKNATSIAGKDFS